MANITTLGTGANKQYKVTYELPRTNGNRHRRSKTFPVGTPYSTVKAFKSKVEQDLVMGKLNMIQDITLEQLAEIYSKNYTQFLSPTTWKGYKSNIYCEQDNKGLVPYFKDYYLTQITTQMVQEYITYLMNTGASSKTVRNYIIVLEVLMGVAEDLGHIPKHSNPCKDVKLPPKTTRRKTSAYTEQELKQLIDLAASDMDYTALLILVLGALCGLRRGEMAGLTWDDVCLDKGASYITINKALVVDGNGKPCIKPPKTENGIRTIPIGVNTADILRSAQIRYCSNKAKRGIKFQDLGYVLHDERNGLNLMPDGINSRYRRFMNRHKEEVGYKNLHCLRHTFASLFATNSSNPKNLQTMLGHADSAFSISQYTHSYSDIIRKETQQLDNSVFGDAKAV